MGYKYDADYFARAGLELASEEGLSRVTFGRLARRLDVNDRTITYYFPTKDDLITGIMQVLGARLRLLLEQAFGDEMLTPAEAAARGWPVLASTNADAILPTVIEMAGLASAGVSPYAAMAPRLFNGWIEWTSARLDVPYDERENAARAVFAQMHGLLVVRSVLGPDVARGAATHMGILSGRLVGD